MLNEWMNLNTLGLIYNIAGAMVLAYSGIAISKRDLEDADLFYSGDVKMRSLVFAKIDSILGASLLVLGFLGQLLGSSQAIAPRFAGQYAPRCFWGLVLLVGLMTIYVLRRRSCARMFYKIKTGKELKL
jgi:hypothetical protein